MEINYYIALGNKMSSNDIFSPHLILILIYFEKNYLVSNMVAKSPILMGVAVNYWYSHERCRTCGFSAERIPIYITAARAAVKM